MYCICECSNKTKNKTKIKTCFDFTPKNNLLKTKIVIFIKSIESIDIIDSTKSR